MYGSRTQSEVGGLISYGTDIPDMYRHAGTYVGRILKGEKPADMPVVQPTKFELSSISRPRRRWASPSRRSFLVRADEVIE